MPDDDASSTFSGFGSVSSNRHGHASRRGHSHRRRRPPSSFAGDPTKSAALLALVALALYALLSGESVDGGVGGGVFVGPDPVDADGDPQRSSPSAAEIRLAAERTTAAVVGSAGENSDDGSEMSRGGRGGGGWLNRRRAALFAPPSAVPASTETKEDPPPRREPDPSYVTLCRSVLRRESDPRDESSRGWAQRSQEIETVYEDSSFCSDSGRPFGSVMTVFVSSLVSEAFGLAYGHGCDLPSSRTSNEGLADASKGEGGTMGRATIQQALPSEWPLLRPGSSGTLTATRLQAVRDGLVAGCSRTVQAWDAGMMEGDWSGPEGIFLAELDIPAAEGATGGDAAATEGRARRTVLSEVLPGLAGMLRAGKDRWGSVVPATRSAAVGASDNANALATQTARRAGAVDSADPTREAAVIYLSCLDDACSDTDGGSTSPALMMPAYYYAHRILPSAASLTILASTSCVDNVDGCRRHGEALAEEMSRLYPQARVMFQVAESTAGAYTQMMGAKYLACPPGASCLLPALAREGYDNTLGAEVTIVDDPEAYPWFRPLRDEYAPWIGLMDHRDFPARALGEDGTTDPKFFLRERPAPDVRMCRLLRGRSGRWVQDMEYAKKAQYKTPLKRYRQMNFQPTEDKPYTSASTYRWEDDFCPMRLADRRGMCELLGNMDVSRLMIVGDSLSQQFAKSTWKLLGHDDDPDPDRKATEGWKPWMQYRWTRTVNCYDAFNEGGRSFTLQFVRNDLLNGETANIDSFHEWGQDTNCGTYSYCFPWLHDYTSYSNPGKTVLVTNLGSHLHSVHDFRAAFDAFASLLEAHRKPDDIVLFRTTVPGHEGCQSPAVRPLQSHSEFDRDVPSDYRSWDLFSAYNDIAIAAIRERVGGRSFRGKEGSLSRVDVLDVYPMTVLRPDGHEGGAEGCVRCKKTDCLHYALPGPPDFWVHLMFSNLADMAR